MASRGGTPTTPLPSSLIIADTGEFLVAEIFENERWNFRNARWGDPSSYYMDRNRFSSEAGETGLKVTALAEIGKPLLEDEVGDSSSLLWEGQ